jgi:hypothetical protein
VTTPKNAESQLVSLDANVRLLECGSSLPFSFPRACSPEVPSRRDLAASWLKQKPQRAAALQNFAPTLSLIGAVTDSFGDFGRLPRSQAFLRVGKEGPNL